MLAQVKPNARLLAQAMKFALLILLGGINQVARAQVPGEVIHIDPSGPSHPFPHYWEQMFGSGRAILSFEQAIATTFKCSKPRPESNTFASTRFFMSEIGLYNEDNAGAPVLQLLLRGPNL